MIWLVLLPSLVFMFAGAQFAERSEAGRQNQGLALISIGVVGLIVVLFIAGQGTGHARDGNRPSAQQDSEPHEWLQQLKKTNGPCCSDSFVLAHDHERPDLDRWYESLRANGVVCCDGPSKDALHLSDVEWRSVRGRYQVYLEGEWIDVPESAVITVPNLDGRALVWPWHKDGHPAVRCFMPGTMT